MTRRPVAVVAAVVVTLLVASVAAYLVTNVAFARVHPEARALVSAWSAHGARGITVPQGARLDLSGGKALAFYAEGEEIAAVDTKGVVTCVAKGKRLAESDPGFGLCMANVARTMAKLSAPPR